MDEFDVDGNIAVDDGTERPKYAIYPIDAPDIQ